ncbi:MAG: hypothetical protein JXB18_14675 [Sedimentisphaerales bacterium]|nr:hypothetical protein [Sedimentisphaerales bacterium]
MNPQDLKRLYELIYAAIEGHSTPEQFSSLKQMLREHPQAIGHYLDFMSILCKVRSSEYFKNSSDRESFDKQFWGMMSQYEKSAPAIEPVKDTPDPSPIQPIDVTYTAIRRRISMSSVIPFAAVAAAVIFVVCFMYFVPAPSRLEVATLTDSISAQWANLNNLSQTGDRLLADGKSMILREGLVELQFDNNAQVVIEAPAEFQILAEDRIGLQYGKVYAIIPREATGFSVYTQNGKVIDFGTEFGVQASLTHETFLHVIRGKTMLIAGGQSDKKNSVEVAAGAAKRVSGISGAISDIHCNESLFVRAIDSASRFIWRGQTAINLADLVGGGNGLGTGRQDFGIGIESGTLSESPLYVNGYGLRNQKSWTSFCPVSKIPGIDGIFIPDSSPEPAVVSSQGHVFDQCPDTNAYWCSPIINGSKSINDELNLIVSDVRYGTPENPAVFMHANIGITFDLQAIRSLLPDGVRPGRFTAIAAAPIPYPDIANYFDIWIVVDGQVRFSRTGVSAPGNFPIDVDLTEQDRFLSLIVTEGKAGRENQGNAYDWCFFCRPELSLEID